MNEDDFHKTAFRTHEGQYKLVIMPFELSNVALKFHETLRPSLWRFIIVLFNDILTYCPTIDSHLQQLTHFFNSLAEANFYLF